MKKIGKESAQELAYLLVRLNRKIFEKHRCAASKFELTPTQWYILRILKQSPRNPSEIAEILGTTRSAVSQQIDALIRKGFLESLEEDSDRRKRSMRITAKAEMLFKKAEEMLTESINEAFSVLDEEELKILAGLLKKVVQ
jgi:DNA-binding MarR family transcriptional regulator